MSGITITAEGSANAATTNENLESKRIDPSRILIIGAGGVGGFICQHIGLLTNVEAFCIADGDNFERSNTSRQGHAQSAIGSNKAEATVFALDSYSPIPCIEPWEEFVKEGNVDELLNKFQPSLIILAVDNDEARKLIFSRNQEYDILWGANELWTPQAGISLKESPWSPLEAFKSAEATGTACGIQTVWANACAASMAMELLALHASEHEKRENLPIFMSKQSNEPTFYMSQNEL